MGQTCITDMEKQCLAIDVNIQFILHLSENALCTSVKCYTGCIKFPALVDIWMLEMSDQHDYLLSLKRNIYKSMLLGKRLVREVGWVNEGYSGINTCENSWMSRNIGIQLKADGWDRYLSTVPTTAKSLLQSQWLNMA